LAEGRLRLPALVAVSALVAGSVSVLAPDSSATRDTQAKTEKLQKIQRAEGAAVVRRISERRRETWRWEALMGSGRTPATYSVERVHSLAYKRWALRVWTRRALVERHRALHPPHLKAWLCIHGYEGAWHDPNPPYFGGLQMDLGFQRTYGLRLYRRKGTADHWTPLEQIWVAERAYQSGRGFYPWPNTARYCGLI
jgi:hypothetical protein